MSQVSPRKNGETTLTPGCNVVYLLSSGFCGSGYIRQRSAGAPRSLQLVFEGVEGLDFRYFMGGIGWESRFSCIKMINIFSPK